MKKLQGFKWNILYHALNTSRQTQAAPSFIDCRKHVVNDLRRFLLSFRVRCTGTRIRGKNHCVMFIHKDKQNSNEHVGTINPTLT